MKKTGKVLERVMRKILMKIKFKPWQETECSECSDTFQVTRTQTKEFRNLHEIVCSDCKVWNEAYDKGLAHGQSQILTICRVSSIQELHKLLEKIND